MTSTAANVLSMWIIGILGVSINHTAASELVYENIAIVLPKQLRVLPPRQAYLAACVVAKDVHPDDAIEWLVHHAALGVGHVYWYDHNSSVDISRHVAPFVQAGQLTWMRITEPVSTDLLSSAPKRNVQLPAYHHCVDMHNIHHEWMMFIDADEFLWVRDAQVSGQGQELPLHALLKEYQGFAGLGVNWLFYGSSGHDSRPTDTTLRSYTRCVSPQEPSMHMRDIHLRHIKMIVHTARLPTPFRFFNPHGGRFVHAAPSPHEADDAGEHSVPQEDPMHVLKSRGQGGPIVDELFRALPEPHLTVNHTSVRITLLHFVLRSGEEFASKVKRGAGDGTAKDMGFFNMVDSVAVENCSVVMVSSAEH